MDKKNSKMKIHKIVKRIKENQLKKNNQLAQSDEKRKESKASLNEFNNPNIKQRTSPNRVDGFNTQTTNTADTRKILNPTQYKPNKIKIEEFITNSKNLEHTPQKNIKLTKDDISTICMNIFNNHATFNNEEKDYFLLYSNLYSILEKLDILSKNLKVRSILKQSEVDILLKKINPSGIQKLNSKQFMNFVAFLAEKIYAEQFNKNPKKGIEKLVKEYLQPYSNYIDYFVQQKIDEDEGEKEEEQEDNNHIKESCKEHFPTSGKFFHKLIQKRLHSYVIDSNSIFLINSIYHGLKNLYTSYFYFETNSFNEPYKIIYGSFNNLAELCRNYEICPYIIPISKLAVLFDIIVNIPSNNITNNEDFPQIFDNKKELGRIFTLSKFSLLIIHLAIFSFEKISKNFDLFNYVTKESHLSNMRFENLNNVSKLEKTGLRFGELGTAEKLILFLERLESSHNSYKSSNKMNKPWNLNLTVIPSKEVIEKLNPNFVKIFGISESQKQEYASNNTNKILTRTNSVIKISPSYEKFSEELREKYENNLESFKEIFEYYSHFGNKMSGNHMTISAFLKFLKDANIISQPKKINLNQTTLPKSKSPSPKKGDSTTIKTLKLINSAIKIKKPEKFTNSPLSQKSVIYNSNSINLTETDASIIFYQITGVKNFYFNEKLKNPFDRTSPKKTPITYSNSLESSRSSSTKNIVANVMDFEKFLKSFELISCKLHPGSSLEDAMITFIDENLNKLIEARSSLYNVNSKNNLLDAIEYLKREDIVKILNYLGVIFQSHFQNYSNSEGLMNFDNFMKFYKDFSIFPDVINQIQAKIIFNILSETYLKEKIESSSKSQASRINLNESTNLKKNFNSNHILPGLNYNFFLQSLALASFHSSTHEEKGLSEKIIHLAAKMGNSHGIEKSQLLSGETFSSNKEINKAVCDIKIAMPDSFKKKRNLRELLKSPTFFEELLDFDSDNEVNEIVENQEFDNENVGDNEEELYDKGDIIDEW